ncbi:MAG: ISKra4 family transposase [Actinocrinis sp.]
MPNPDGAFGRSLSRFGAVLVELGDPLVDIVTHLDIEDWLLEQGRDLMRSLFQDHLDLRASRESRRADVVAVDEDRARTRVECSHVRTLTTVFGQVVVERLAYRAPGSRNLYPADAVLGLPVGEHSHGLRRLAAIEATRGSFGQAAEAIGRATGVGVGKRQVEALAVATAGDLQAFYAGRCPGPCQDTVTLVLTFDGKGIVMRPDALRPGTAKAAAKADNKLATRLSRGEKANRKRIAEVVAVYDAAPAPRASGDVMARAGTEQAPAPKATAKWLTASVENDANSVVAAGFDEAERRDPTHRRTWIALVDGQAHQIKLVRAEAARRKVKVTIVCDFVHVLEYIWKAGWCFFAEGDKNIETWVADHARRILEGKAGIVAAAIRRKATTNHLEPAKRKNADTTARYLMNLRSHLRYDTALAAGWPIATSVIEGAVRHLVKDRMDITGARWGLPGAEAILKLRALVANGDFDAYWHFHVRQEQHRVHDARYRANLTLAA